MVVRAARLLLLVAAACAPVHPATVPQGSLAQIAARAPLTVLVFFSAHCPCQTAHDERLIALDARYAPRGVQFYAVDSELGASAQRDAAEAEKRRYPFPILTDHGAKLAAAVGAESATFTIVVERGGAIRYRGGIDSDRTHLTPQATPYLGDALDDLLAGRAPRLAEAKALGCALEK